MEEPREERQHASRSIRQLESAAQLLSEASKAADGEKISSGFSGRLTQLLNAVTAISSVEEAERLLATGVSMWNSAIHFENQKVEESTAVALVTVRHAAVDCMHMSTTVLGGISSQYSIDELSLLKFYTACGQKYSHICSDFENAEICYSRAMDFAEKAIENSRTSEADEKVYAKALFDLLLGKAECAWSKDDFEEAESRIKEARVYLTQLPDEHEYLAAVEYNFGLYKYQNKDPESASRWLKCSIQTRGHEENTTSDVKKQAMTMRLLGVCLLAMKQYEESWEMMNEAEKVHSNSTGAFLLIKLALLTKKSNAVELLHSIIDENDCNLDVSVAAICLFIDAHRFADAIDAFEKLFLRFRESSKAICDVIGPRYFEVLIVVGNVSKATEVLDVCLTEIEKVNSNSNSSAAGGTSFRNKLEHLSRWSGLLLAMGITQADRNDFSNASKFLTRSLSIARHSSYGIDRTDVNRNATLNFPALENEAVVCRLAASCALSSVQRQPEPVSVQNIASHISSEKSAKLSREEEEMVQLAVSQSKRAIELDTKDFSPRLLLFRCFLLLGEHAKAANVLKIAHDSHESFDPGALAEAACAAHDAGSQESVIAALRCILCLNPEVVSKSSISSSVSSQKGFLGSVLIACVNTMLLHDASVISKKDGQTTTTDDEVKLRLIESKVDRGLLEVLTSGIEVIEAVGFEFVFDTADASVWENVGYLADIAWNSGRKAGVGLQYASWESFFDICFKYTELLPTSPRKLHTQRMSMLMCASSIVENPNSTTEDFKRAVRQIRVANRLSTELHTLTPGRSNPVNIFLLVLEARCHVGITDISGLANVVETALKCDVVTVGVLEQLASVCFDFRRRAESRDNEGRVRCVDLTVGLLSKAVEMRLADDKTDVQALAVTLRENLGAEFCRSPTSGRSFVVFQRMVGIINELGEKYPDEERRWVVAVGWDRAEMYKRLGQRPEARRWCECVIKATEGSLPLTTYRPKLEKFLESLGRN